eukprot:CAMPEP_0196593148 /NCGR_PEP_ID=MMETSP1081-20130531/74791_1 /TAXON_ID=36882 /ORGANISM="Pyramimonas amylifera, Strain CCMP720" /LENGTH=377 /DNA_ID=CAMNT_0041917037 /DNA_START=310 /DNA_END=1443 /DNA_ORIENTATION=-
MHGYSFILETAEMEEVQQREPWYNVYWVKVVVLKKYLPFFDWVIYLDADTVVRNFKVKLEWFINNGVNEGVDVVLMDHNVNMNNGAVFVRRSDWSFQMLETWMGMGRQAAGRGSGRWSWDDQGAMWGMLLQHAGSSNLCNQDGVFDGGQKLEACVQAQLTKLGHPYLARRVPHYKFINPGQHHVPGGSGQVIVGGFNQYRREDIQAIEPNMLHFFNQWREETYFKDGSFIVHVLNKGRLSLETPPALATDCQVATGRSGQSGVEKRAGQGGVVAVAAEARGVSCSAACSSRGMFCDPLGVLEVNSCDLMREHLGCGACRRDYGPTNPSTGPAKSEIAKRNGFRDCLIHGMPKFEQAIGFKCEATHPETQRVCPCRSK